MGRWISAFYIILLVASGSPARADEVPGEQLERWFKSDELDGPAAPRVNGGELQFLEQPPAEPIHHHHNTLTIRASSVEDGWVELRQCHTHLDKVGAAQILFKAQRVRDLEVIEASNMERAWVEGPSVQMTRIRANARLCLKARTRALERTADGIYVLRNGPFMRRFLDGYFPLRVSMDIFYGQSGLELIDFSPPAQHGFEVRQQSGELHFDAVFEGRLVTEFRFRK